MHETHGKSDEWFTPAYIFEALGLHFDLDVAAPYGGPLHTPCDQWHWQDSLSLPWRGTVWMNPPFGNQNQKRQWLSKFFDHGNGVALVPDRTSAPWWQEFAPLADVVCFVAPKVKFIRADGTLGESPSTGTCLLAAGAKSKVAVANCGLGVVFRF